MVSLFFEHIFHLEERLMQALSQMKGRKHAERMANKKKKFLIFLLFFNSVKKLYNSVAKLLILNIKRVKKM